MVLLITLLKPSIKCIQMYLKFTIGKEKQLINYRNGVSQGDNALPFLFLFLMMVATGSFRSVFQLEEKHIFHYFPDHKHPDKQKGRLKEQSTKAGAKPLRLAMSSMLLMMMVPSFAALKETIPRPIHSL